MGKIGDLFVRLGLKKSDYSKGLKEAKTEAKSFGSQLGTILKGVAAGFGAVTVVVGIVTKALGTLARQNNTLSDTWNQTVASMKAAWDSFKTDVANTDFTGVVERARAAAAAAAEYYNAKDWDFEVEQANRLIQAGMAAEIEALQDIARDQTKSNQERMDAINKILEKTAPVYANTIAQNAITAEASLNQFISNATGQAAETITKEARDAWTDYIKWQGQVANRSVVDAADALRNAQRMTDYWNDPQRYQEAGQTGSKKALENVEKQRAAAAAELAKAEALFKKLGGTQDLYQKRIQYNDRINDEKTTQMVDDVERYLLSQAAQQRENRRLTTLLHSLEKQGTGGGGTIDVPEIDPFEGMEESARKMVETYKGNVDLLARPIVDAADLAAAGWEEAGEKFKTTFSQLVETTDADGETVRMLVTPILDNGTVLSPQALQDYIEKNLKGAEDLLDADKLGIVIDPKVDGGEEATKNLEDLQDAYYAAALAVAEYTKRMKEEREAAEASAKAEAEKAAAAEKAAEAERAAAEAAKQAKIEEQAKKFEEAAERWKEAATEGFSAGCQEMMDQLFGLKEVNAGAVLQALLDPLADMAIKEGEILVAEGIGIEACKEALESLNGYAAIAAGTALILIGSAAKAGLKALANSHGGSNADTQSSYTYSGGRGVAGISQLNSGRMELSGTVTVKGQDLQIALDNYNRNKKR